MSRRWAEAGAKGISGGERVPDSVTGLSSGGVTSNRCQGCVFGGHELLNKAGVIKPASRGWKGQGISQGSDRVREPNVIIQTKV